MALLPSPQTAPAESWLADVNERGRDLVEHIANELALPSALLEILADDADIPRELRPLLPLAQAALMRVASYAHELQAVRCPAS